MHKHYATQQYKQQDHRFELGMDILIGFVFLFAAVYITSYKPKSAADANKMEQIQQPVPLVDRISILNNGGLYYTIEQE